MTNARAVVPLEGDLTPADVGPLGCAGMTAYGAVKKALPYAVPGTYNRGAWRRRPGPHRHPGAARAVPDRDHRGGPQRGGAEHARGWGADQTVQAVEGRSHAQQIRDLTGGGANVVIDFVGEGGAERDAVELLGTRGVGIMVGYGGKMEIEILSQALFPETSFLGTYNEAVELAKINVPTFVTGAVADHLTPWTGCYRTTQLLGGDAAFVLSYSGRIASVEAFDRHYEGTHAVLAAKLPGLRSLTTCRPGPDADGNKPPYHLIVIMIYLGLGTGDAGGALRSGGGGRGGRSGQLRRRRRADHVRSPPYRRLSIRGRVVSRGAGHG